MTAEAQRAAWEAAHEASTKLNKIANMMRHGGRDDLAAIADKLSNEAVMLAAKINPIRTEQL